jgi:glycosyltransferase involved in cell wall biosynthesis
LAYNAEQPDETRPGRYEASVYHVMSAFEPGVSTEAMWPSWARRPEVSLVVTVYDLIPLIFSEHYLADPQTRVAYRARADLIRHADGILAISRSTATDVVERLGVAPDRVHVIHAGATNIFGPMYAGADAAWTHLHRALPAVRRGFVLYVGGFEFRKNLEGLIAGYARIPREVRARHQLVIACRLTPEQMALLRRVADDEGLGARELVLTGYVSDVDLGALYHACTLFVFPSLYEGSGLPILEAMACGAPVVASATATGPEILGDERGTFDPLSPEAIAACIEGVLGSPGLLASLSERSRLRAAEYTWERVARESLDAYERILERRVRRPPRRPRLALATPWLPEPSGIAQYNLRLAAALGRHADVDVVVAESLDNYPEPREEGVRLVAASDFEQQNRLRQHDRVVYCMGNSRFHGYVYELLRRRTGTVVLHDVRLTGFFGWYAGIEHPANPAGRLAERLMLQYGPRLPPEVVSGGPPSWQDQLALGLYLTREVQSLASRVLVHSRFARDVLRLEAGGNGSPVSIVPFGMPDPSAAPRSGAGSGPPLIVSLGYVSEVKGVGTLIDAFAAAASRLAGARLVIAGPMEGGETRRWRTYAAEHAPGLDVQLPGEVSSDEYVALLCEADVAVQLRLISNGEASAAVADCVAAGVPTIVTDLGWAGELPATVVEKVPVDITTGQLADRLVALSRDGARRAAMSQAALDHARSRGFAEVAQAYLVALGLG